MRKLLMVLLLIGLTLPALAEGPAYRVEGDALIYPPAGRMRTSVSRCCSSPVPSAG